MKLRKIKTQRLIKVLFLCICSILFCLTHASAYTPPIGIPDPGIWGSTHPIEGVTPNVTTKCPGWPSAQTSGCYYYDPSHSNATDSGNTNGYPDKPRKTIANGTYAPGTYMFLGGQVTTQSSSIRFNCTAEQPCWITSSPSDQGGFSGDGRLAILGNTHYLFIEYLLINNKTANNNSSAISISNTPSVTDSADHISIRHNIVKDIIYNASNAVFSTTARDGGSVNDIVFFNNTCNHVGDPLALTDEDLHSISVGLRYGTQTTSFSYNIWVLNNRFTNSTQGLQINGWPGGQPNLNHIYVGKNYGENERQRSLSTKQASHVIFSQNEVIPGVNIAAGGVSESFGWSLGADYVWFLFNNIHGGADGFRSSDSSGGTSATARVFIIGNTIYNIAPNQYMTYDPTNGWRYGQGIDLKNGSITLHVVDNTFSNVYGGILVDKSDTVLYIHGNIFNGIHPQDTFIDSSLNSDIALFHIANNLYHDTEGDHRWRVRSENYTTLESWKAVFPQFDKDSKRVDPLFIDAAQANFAIDASSGAIGANKNENTEYGYPDVYALFESLYGLNIRVDYNGNPRPVNEAWTLGAFEYGSLSSVPLPTPPAPSVNLNK